MTYTPDNRWPNSTDFYKQDT